MAPPQCWTIWAADPHSSYSSVGSKTKCSTFRLIYFSVQKKKKNKTNKNQHLLWQPAVIIQPAILDCYIHLPHAIAIIMQDYYSCCNDIRPLCSWGLREHCVKTSLHWPTFLMTENLSRVTHWWTNAYQKVALVRVLRLLAALQEESGELQGISLGLAVRGPHQLKPVPPPPARKQSRSGGGAQGQPLTQSTWQDHGNRLESQDRMSVPCWSRRRPMARHRHGCSKTQATKGVSLSLKAASKKQCEEPPLRLLNWDFQGEPLLRLIFLSRLPATSALGWPWAQALKAPGLWQVSQAAFQHFYAMSALPLHKALLILFLCTLLSLFTFLLYL